jgi:alpha-L-arabinofuranosidase
VGGDQPAVNAGSPTYPLDVVTAFTSDRKFLTLAVVNPTTSRQRLDLKIDGVRLQGKSRFCQMTGPSVDAADVLGQKPEVETVETPLPEVPTTLWVAPISINIYEFRVQ